MFGYSQIDHPIYNLANFWVEQMCITGWITLTVNLEMQSAHTHVYTHTHTHTHTHACIYAHR